MADYDIKKGYKFLYPTCKKNKSLLYFPVVGGTKPAQIAQSFAAKNIFVLIEQAFFKFSEVLLGTNAYLLNLKGPCTARSA